MVRRPYHITKKRTANCFLPITKVLFATVLLYSYASLSAKAASVKPASFTITIDAGHGGKDTGAPGKKSVEKNIALAIALKLGDQLKEEMNDVNVFFTRSTDIFIPLYERAQIANRNKSDLFVSIHVNAVKSRTAPSGTSTYVMGYSRSAENLDLVMQENKAIYLEQDYKTRYAGFDPASPESYIIFNNVQNNNLTQSLELATAVQEKLRVQAQRKDLGVHQGNLVVLWGCAKPSILVETGFISNPQEEAFLMTDSGQDQIASAIFEAIREYKESVDNRVSSLKGNPAIQADTPRQTGAEVKVSDEVKKQPETVARQAVESPKEAEPVKKASMKDTSGSHSANPPKEQKIENEVHAKTETPKPTESGIMYRVQVIASATRLRPGSSEFKGLKDLEEMPSGGLYKYLTKPVTDYSEALELRRKLAASFKGAFVVVFRDGQRVPLNTVMPQKKK